MRHSPARIVTGCVVMAVLIWQFAQWDWAGILSAVLHAVPLVVIGVVVVPAGVLLFLFGIMSIPPKRGGR